MYSTLVYVCLRLRMDLSSQDRWHVKPGWFMNAMSADTKRNEHRLWYKSTTGTFHSSLCVRPDGCVVRKRGVRAPDIPVKGRPYQVLFTGVQVAVEWRGSQVRADPLNRGLERWAVGISDFCLLIIIEVLSINSKMTDFYLCPFLNTFLYLNVLS